MMECPRCGFQQPDDKYCANCGLNVALFRNKPKPLLQKILSNPLFYISMTLLLIGSLYWYIQISSLTSLKKTDLFESIPQKLTHITKALNQEPTEQELTEGESPTPKPQPQIPRKSIRPKSKKMEGTESSTQENETPALKGPQPAMTPPAPSPKDNEIKSKDFEPKNLPSESAVVPIQIEVSFYETPRDLWNQLETDGKILVNTGKMKLSSFVQKEKLLSLLNNSRPIHGSRLLNSQNTGSLNLHFPFNSANPESTLGLFVNLNINKINNSAIELDTSVAFTPYSAPPSAQRKESVPDNSIRFETVAHLHSGGALVINNLLPRKPLPEPEREKLIGSPLVVLNSPDFIEGISEFLIVIQTK
ncbi:MAG: hypothetical protein K1X29_09745 [Bdellovibrionales bacterium]|nr:hypothetical protein [Bdellovibrionales bacterium]